MQDLNYFPLEVESNIYSMTRLEFDDRTSKLLVATLDCKIFCINYNKSKPHTREVEFTYIPNGAKISSVGALKRGPNDFVIGITHSLAPINQKGAARSSSSFSAREGGDYSRMTSYYFNIYASGSATQQFDLDYVAQGCQTIRLRYVPYHLYSTELVALTESGTITTKPYWLLSGGDNCIHAFCEDRQSFTESPIEDCFPELGRLPGLTLWIDVLNIDDAASGHTRAVALGFEDGSVRLYHSVLSKITKRFELVTESSFDDYTTIIPSVRLFRVKSTKSSKLRDALKTKELLRETYNKNLEQLNLLVVSSTNSSIVFQNVLELGLKSKFELPESQRLDCSVTSTIGDTNLDGLNELMIGTHGRELLTYQYNLKTNQYQLNPVSELNYPIFAMSILDLTGDALNDLIILLASGILIMQASVRDVVEVVKKRVETLLQLVT